METYPVGVSELPTHGDLARCRRRAPTLLAGSAAPGVRRRGLAVARGCWRRRGRGAARCGDHFGEFTLLRGLPSPVTIVTEEPTTVDVLTGAEFRGTLGPTTRFRASLERTLDGRIRDWVATADAAICRSARDRMSAGSRPSPFRRRVARLSRHLDAGMRAGSNPPISVIPP